MLLRHGLGLPDEARAVEAAVNRVVSGGTVTGDLGGSATTSGFAQAVARAIEPSHWGQRSSHLRMHWA